VQEYRTSLWKQVRM